MSFSRPESYTFFFLLSFCVTPYGLSLSLVGCSAHLLSEFITNIILSVPKLISPTAHWLAQKKVKLINIKKVIFWVCISVINAYQGLLPAKYGMNYDGFNALPDTTLS